MQDRIKKDMGDKEKGWGLNIGKLPNF